MLLEVVNALLFAFLVTETDLQWTKVKQHVKTIAALVAANVCLSETSSALLSHLSPGSTMTAVQSKGRLMAHALLFRPLDWLGSTIGTAGVMALLVMLVALAVLHTQRVERYTAWAGLAGLASFTLLWVVGADSHVHHQEPLKVLTLLLLFGSVCLADIRVKLPQFTVQQFVSNGTSAVLLVLPVCPCLSVLLSTGFLVVITVLENLRINPQFLNPAIYWGTLYGPLVFVYYETKKMSIRQGVLPM